MIITGFNSKKPNVLKGTRVYLIGAMQYSSNGRSWREKVKSFLKPRNIVVFDPYDKPFKNSAKEDEKVHKLLRSKLKRGCFNWVASWMKRVRGDDLRLCDSADFFIVNINPTVPSWGSAEELFWANRMKKPIFLVVEGGKKKTPFWIFGTIPHKYIYSSIDSALKMIAKIDDGERAIDSSRWKLFKEEYL